MLYKNILWIIKSDMFITVLKIYAYLFNLYFNMLYKINYRKYLFVLSIY